MFDKNKEFNKFNRHRRYVVLVYVCLFGFLQALPVIALAEEASSRARVAILPFENMSGQFLVVDEVMKTVYQNLGKVFDLPSYESVDEVVLRLRLRHTGYLSSQEASEIGRRLGVDAIILGMICVYQEMPEPRIGLILKMIGTWEGLPILWMKSSVTSGSITQTWFGRNRISKINYLIHKVIEDMLKELPTIF